MAKICPLTGKGVIYLTCMDCDKKYECRQGKLNVKENDKRKKDK